MNILDRVAKSAAKIRYGQFRPATTQEFFALRLAAKLGDASAGQHYADLADRFSQARLLTAYARGLPSNTNPARRFHAELESGNRGNGGDQGANRLASVRIERRAVGFAILRGDHLVHADARQLSSVPDKALNNAVSFATRFLDRFDCKSAALEIIPYGREVQRTTLHQAVLHVLSAQGIGIIEVPKSELLAGFAYPNPRFRSEVREIISAIYPALDQQPGGPWTHDAAALGLYVQIERLFNTINQPLPMIGPLPYIGGKNRLAAKIISLLPEHTTYVEPFAGGAQVLFHKAPSNVEVLNDLDFDVVNFFRVCQWHYEELVRYLRYCLASRKLHELHLASNPATLTDIQRAGRFFYLQKNSFGGLILKQKFHYGVTQNSNYNLERIPEAIERAHQRLLRVQIESLPYEQILERYDRPTTFFYLDPPYWGPKLYKFNFTEDAFKAMATRLTALKGKFILSLNDREEVRETFKEFRIQREEIAYTAQARPGKRYGELLITNYKPKENGPVDDSGP